MRSGEDRIAKQSKARRAGIQRGSGDVFADLGLPDSAELLIKSEIVSRIASIMTSRSLTQVEAAALLGVSQADVSNLVRGRLRRFSTDRLFRFLNALGQDVEIRMPSRVHRRRAGRLRIVNEGSRGMSKLSRR
jgi:predicted XRE-type DNA-binding protein